MKRRLSRSLSHLDLGKAVTLFTWALVSACSTTAEPQARPPAPAQVTAAAAPAPGPAPAPAAEKPEFEARSPGGAPVVVKLVGPDKVTPGKPVELKVVIERVVKGTPLFLKISLPPGASLASGQMSERIDDDGDRIERTIVLNMVGKTPADDVKIAVDTGAEHFGAHATASYRFGRPVPKMADPALHDAPLIINGQDFGATIPIGAKKTAPKK
jgi:hypothetical protein